MNDAIPADAAQPQAHNKLTTYVERMERMLDEIDQLKDGLKDLKAEIRPMGSTLRPLTVLLPSAAARKPPTKRLS